ncbi:MAG: hypothetical protein ACJAZJ_000085 [Candidatus Endobugula sp.]|jgi:hypothetical protein
MGNTANMRERTLGGRPRIENLLRKSYFGAFFRPFSSLNSAYCWEIEPLFTSNVQKNALKLLSLATASILGQPPRSLPDLGLMALSGLSDNYQRINTNKKSGHVDIQRV